MKRFLQLVGKRGKNARQSGVLVIGEYSAGTPNLGDTGLTPLKPRELLNKSIRMTMKTNALKLIASLVVCGLAASAQAQTLVAPGNLTSTEGDSNNGFPFNIQVQSLSSQRYQQVYDASLFSSLPAGGVEITGIAFRVDDSFGNSFSSTLPDIQLDLSTTSAGESTLSTTFASNVGGDDKIVFAAGPLSLSGTGGGSPNPFDVIINFSQPFAYNPANGNLLLDVHNFGGGLTTQFDATDISGDGMSRVTTYIGQDVGSATANLSDSNGLVTEFIYQPVPEPTTLALAGLSGLSLLLFRRQRK
jgi:PEP-CTERM motif